MVSNNFPDRLGSNRTRRKFAASLWIAAVLIPNAWAVVAPTFEPASGYVSPADGFYSATPALNGLRQYDIKVSRSASEPTATITYTTDGSEPTLASPAVAHDATLTFGRNVTLKAKAWIGSTPSTTTTATYNIVHALAAGDSHSMAITFDGKLYAWGKNVQGRLGLGNTTTPYAVPTANPSFSSGVMDIDGGADDTAATPRAHSILVKEDGSVWCAGSGVNGRLGHGLTSDSTSWVQVKTSSSVFLGNIRSVAAGASASYALSNDGYVYSWGRNDSTAPRLGHGSLSGQDIVYATRVKTSSAVELDRIIAIAAGDSHAIALRDDGTVWAWGANNVGQIGDGNTADQAYAVKVHAGATNANIDADLVGIVDIAAGAAHNLAVTSTGRAVGWGQQATGRLGNGYSSGTSSAKRRPAYVEESGTVPQIADVAHVAAGGTFSMLLKTDKSLYAFGSNDQHQIGDDTTTTRSYPKRVKGSNGSDLPATIVDMAAGHKHGLALDQDGKIYTWGLDTSGQLGDNTASSADTAKATNSQYLPTLKNRPPTLGSLSATTTTSWVAPAEVTLTANSVADLDLNLAGVDFEQTLNSVKTSLGTDTTPTPFSLTVSNLAAGSYIFEATARDAVGLESATVVTTPTSPITIVNPVIAGQLPLVTATQTSAANAVLPSSLSVTVRGGVGGPFLTGRAVTFSVEGSGGGQVGPTSTGPWNPTAIVNTSSGNAAVWFRQPTRGALETQIQASVSPGGSSALFKALTHALVGRWLLNESGVTTTASDNSGAANSGVIVQPEASWTQGDGSSTGALAIAGNLYSNQTGLKVSNTGHRILPSSGAYSVLMWFRADQLQAGRFYTLICNETAGVSGFRAGIDCGVYGGSGPNLQVWSTYSGGSVSIRPSVVIKPGWWYHLAITYSGTEAKVYLNGVPVGQQAGTILSNTNDIRFGAGLSGNYNLGGAIDDVYVYHDEQNGASVASHMNAITDWDSLIDSWERQYFGTLQYDGYSDPDGDGLSNVEERDAGTDPSDPDSDDDQLNDRLEVIDLQSNPWSTDSDGDTLPDYWEYTNGTNINADDRGADPDQDGLSNLEEYGYGTHPNLWDSDSDGLSDGFEVLDYDGDGLSNGAEAALVGGNLNADFDVDGRPNYADADSDGDGYHDGADFDPLNSGVKVGSTPGDSTPPVLTVTKP